VVAALAVVLLLCRGLGVLLVDRVVIYSPDRGVVLATHIQALAEAAAVLAATVHTTAVMLLALLMGQAVAAVGVRVVAATV
jgi:hypothetical protein